MNVEDNSLISSPKPILHKRKAGRKKFRETRHPVYRGVRRRNTDKWVCEVREPNNNKSRVWVGTFFTPEMAARAHDVAVLALRGGGDRARLRLNFPDSARVLPRAKSCSARDIQMAALEATRDVSLPNEAEEESAKVAPSEDKDSVFLDEEAMFNMPGLLDSMAEGLMLTPPALKRGFNWDDGVVDCDMDVTLWSE